MGRHSHKRHRRSASKIPRSPDNNTSGALRFVDDDVVSSVSAAVTGFSTGLCLGFDIILTTPVAEWVTKW